MTGCFAQHDAILSRKKYVLKQFFPDLSSRNRETRATRAALQKLQARQFVAAHAFPGIGHGVRPALPPGRCRDAAPRPEGPAPRDCPKS